MPDADLLTSGQLASFIGRSRETVRRYEALGLIPTGRRDPINRHRYWTADQAEQIRQLLKPVAVDGRQS
jgi:DNA-binding transcriptional MerR regulator